MIGTFRRGKKVLKPTTRDKNARYVPQWGGGRGAYYIPLCYPRSELEGEKRKAKMLNGVEK